MDEALTALKSGYGENMPDNNTLVEMALRSVVGGPVGTDRSGQFVARPTHRNSGGKSKETPTEKAERGVKAWMDANPD